MVKKDNVAPDKSKDVYLMLKGIADDLKKHNFNIKSIKLWADDESNRNVKIIGRIEKGK